MINVEAVSHTYPHVSAPVPALREVDLHIPQGQFVALLGASGSGKSTLLKVLGGLLTPTAGKVWIGEQEITQLSDSALTRFRRQAIGFVFQDYNLLPVLTALENIIFGLQLKGIPPKETREKASHWLAQVGLAGKEKSRPAQLSGGQQQRVAIARALAMQPQVLIADEPTSSLDSQNTLQIAELLKNLQTATQTTLILATHDTRLLPFADRQIEMQDGRIL